MAATSQTTDSYTRRVVLYCVSQRLHGRPSSGKTQNGRTKRPAEMGYDEIDGHFRNGHSYATSDDEMDGVSHDEVDARTVVRRTRNVLNGDDLELRPEMSDTLRRLTAEFEKRYHEVFKESIDNIFLTPSNIQHMFLSAVITMFHDGIINWGRIVAVLAFSGAVASKCIAVEMPYLVNEIIDWTIDYINQNLSTWIDENGGWDGFVTFFKSTPVHSVQTGGLWPSISTLCGAAVGAIGALTIGALLTK